MAEQEKFMSELVENKEELQDFLANVLKKYKDTNKGLAKRINSIEKLLKAN